MADALDLVSPFRFLDLPTELRLRVYTYILPRQPFLVLQHLKTSQYPMPRYDFAALRTCHQIHDELFDHFYKNQVLVMNVYDIGESVWAVEKTTPRDYCLAMSMRRETRSHFKTIEIRCLTMKDPDGDRKDPCCTGIDDDTWPGDPCLTEILETFPNLEHAIVSFEIDGIGSGWALEDIARFLISDIPDRIQIRWDFKPTSESNLNNCAGEEAKIMDELKKVVEAETVASGNAFELGRRIADEHVSRSRVSEIGILEMKSRTPSASTPTWVQWC